MIYLIRHCEAEGNVYRRVHGHYDGYPTANGIKQCAALAARMAGTPLTAVYASDLTRARCTAAAVAARGGLPVQVNPGFREINLGVWEDMTWGETARDYPVERETFDNRLWEFSITGGETAQQVCDRFIISMNKAANANTGNIAIVSHGAAIRCVVSELTGSLFGGLQQFDYGDNTSVTKITFAPGGAPCVEYYADNSHLAGLSAFDVREWRRDAARPKENELCFDPVVFPEESKIVERLRREAWLTVYNTLEGFNAKAMLADAKHCQSQNKKAVVLARRQGDVIGILQLDPSYRAEAGLGHISLVALDGQNRGRGLGIQLIGHAISVYRALGRKALHLRVADSNERAIRFYTKLGFEKVGVEDAMLRPLIIMHKSIEPPIV